MQGAHLGVDAQAFDEDGNSLRNDVGELVITQPMPSMPVDFWNDEDDERYKATYFDIYPGVWRQGDFFMVNDRGAISSWLTTVADVSYSAGLTQHLTGSASALARPRSTAAWN
jgi:acyl-coenzyme A synthetase/AMP-(fatty) acid ligase